MNPQTKSNLSPFSFKQALEDISNQMETLIQYIVSDEEHVEFETKINHLIVELWDLNYSTDSLESAKIQIVYDYMDEDEDFQMFLTSLDRILEEATYGETTPTSEQQRQVKALEVLDFDTDEESLFAIAEKLLDAYNQMHDTNIDIFELNFKAEKITC